MRKRPHRNDAVGSSFLVESQHRQSTSVQGSQVEGPGNLKIKARPSPASVAGRRAGLSI